jgi:3-oxoacyl-[acyl-carrier-protein] synthase II
MEVRALHAALGAAAETVPVTAMKGAIGHSFGPSGLVETIASFEAARRGVLPAVTGLAKPESGLSLATQARPLANPLFVKTSAGFGGFDAAVVGRGVP